MKRMEELIHLNKKIHFEGKVTEHLYDAFLIHFVVHFDGSFCVLLAEVKFLLLSPVFW